MCYSAQIERDYGKYLRVVGPQNALSIEDFVRKYWERQKELPSMKIPKAVDAWFANPKNGDEQKIAAFIEDFNDEEILKYEQEIFKQRKRVVDAQRILQTRSTKKATDDVRIGTDKIEYALGKLADIRRTDFKPRDARVFPSWFAPIIVSENGANRSHPKNLDAMQAIKEDRARP